MLKFPIQFVVIIWVFCCLFYTVHITFQAVSRSNLFSATMRSMSAFESLPVSLVMAMALVLPVLWSLAHTFKIPFASIDIEGNFNRGKSRGAWLEAFQQTLSKNLCTFMTQMNSPNHKLILPHKIYP